MYTTKGLHAKIKVHAIRIYPSLKVNIYLHELNRNRVHVYILYNAPSLLYKLCFSTDVASNFKQRTDGY